MNKEALDRVKASYAMANDNEATSGTYQTNDIKSLLDSLNERQEVINNVKDDLDELKDWVETSSDEPDKTVLQLIDSTLKLLD